MQTQELTWLDQRAFIRLFIDNTEVQTKEENRARDKYINVLLATVCHDFRTPINTVQSNLRRISQEQELTVVSKEKMRTANTSISILNSMIDDIMDIAKFE